MPNCGFVFLVVYRLDLAYRVAIHYTSVIRSYRHKGLKKFAQTGSQAGIQGNHSNRLRRLLTALDVASQPGDMNAPGNNLHALAGDLVGHWSVNISGNWRLTFAFEGEDAVLVDYLDYH